jgi:hypothetical protein
MTIKIMTFPSVCCSSEEHNFLSNIKVLFPLDNYTTKPQALHLGIINAFKFQYRKQLIFKTITIILVGGLFKLLHTLSYMCLQCI